MGAIIDANVLTVYSARVRGGYSLQKTRPHSRVRSVFVFVFFLWRRHLKSARDVARPPLKRLPTHAVDSAQRPTVSRCFRKHRICWRDPQTMPNCMNRFFILISFFSCLQIKISRQQQKSLFQLRSSGCQMKYILITELGAIHLGSCSSSWPNGAN